MRARRKTNLLLAGMSALTVMGIIGSTAGTLAWYAFFTRTTLSFRGTSVKSTEQLQVGLVANTASGFNLSIDDDKLESLELIKEDDKDGKVIYWSATGVGLSSNAVKEYLSDSSYAYNKLSPVTSGAVAINGEVNLLKAPQRGDAIINQAALKENYVYLQLAFRVIDKDGHTVNGNHVWITDTLAQASDSSKTGAEKAIRVYVENQSEESNNHFLLNPSAKTGETGSTKVAGLLDLTGKGYYDTLLNGKEIVYGDYTLNGGRTEVEYSDSPYVIPTPPETYDLDNVNGVVGDETLLSTPSTFLARHAEGAYTVNTASFTAKVAAYDTVPHIGPDEDLETGKYDENSGKPVTCTDSANNIGYADLTIYLEGWDHAVVDRINGYGFNLGIQFEINRS